MLKLEHFFYMSEIARSGSISRAAENLYISQPYLSTSLKELENELCIKLFVRTHKGVVLTEAGKRFLACAKTVEDAVREVRLLTPSASGVRQKLSIASIYSFTMLDLFDRFARQESFAGADITYAETPNKDIPDMVAQGVFDVGVIYLRSLQENAQLEKLEQKGLLFSPLCRERLYLVVSAGHPLASRSEVRHGELADYPLIVERHKRPTSEPPEDNNPFPEYFRSSPQKPVLFDNNRSLMYYLTKSATCFTLGQKCLNLSNPFVKSGQLVYIPISDLDAWLTTGYVVKANRPFHNLQHSFIEHLEKFFTEYGAGVTEPL